jgi:hypothetical protein
MLTGVLIAESLRVGSTLSGVPLQLNKIRRIDADSAAGEQPEQWTLVEFHAPAAEAERLAEALAGCLRPTSKASARDGTEALNEWA